MDARDEWLMEGMVRGWIGPPWCYVHGEPALTDEEQAAVDEADGDMDVICVVAARLQ
jgi:hypothetical protein